MKDIKNWELLESRELFAAPPWVRLWIDRIKLPGGRIVDDYYRVDLQEYVVIFARGDNGDVLLQRQYKHALKDVVLSLPGGCLDNGELPLEGAKREFLEETGYIAHDWKYAGNFLVDGNKGCGKVNFFIAEKLEKVAEPVEDDTEETENLFMPVNLVLNAVRNGDIPMLAAVSLIAIATNPAILDLR